MTLSTPDLEKLRELAEKATPVTDANLMRYEHGGGWLAILTDGRWDLIADFYDEADREFYAAANPATILALLSMLPPQSPSIPSSGVGGHTPTPRAQAEARKLLVHYLTMPVAGGFYNGGSIQEMSSIVDLIVEAAVERIAAKAGVTP